MRRGVMVWLVLGTIAVSEGGAQEVRPPQSMPVTLADFRSLSWLVGRWRGGPSPVFYEQYRFRDDSTIAMTAYTDSTFATATADSSMIEWRQGQVRTRTARSTYDAIEVAPGRIRFRRTGAPDGGHRFERVSADEWIATLFPRGAGTDTVVYRMRRLSP